MPAPTPGLAPAAYRLVLRDVLLQAGIGVLPDERLRRQALRLDAVLTLRQPPAPEADSAADVLSYMDVVTAAEALAAGPHIGLLESFAQRLAARLLEDQRITRLELSLDKPEVLGGRGSVGVQFVWERP